MATQDVKTLRTLELSDRTWEALEKIAIAQFLSGREEAVRWLAENYSHPQDSDHPPLNQTPPAPEWGSYSTFF
jgi:hypothetical protein